MTKDQIFAYIAGYIDGDGCFNSRIEPIRKTFKYPAQLIVTSTDKLIMEFLKKNIGGNFTFGKFNPKKPNHKPCHRFCICGKAAAEITKRLIPFLVEKRSQAECFIKFVETKDTNKKITLCEKMNFLKKSQDFVKKTDKETLVSIKQTVQPTSNEIPYIAGFIDAECSLGVYRYRGRDRSNYLYKGTLSLNNTKLPCFSFLMSRFGGCISFVAGKDLANDQFMWRISSKKLRDIIHEIQPFLLAKKPVCNELIKFFSLSLPNGGARHTEAFRSAYQANLVQREEIRKSINHLNKRGLK